MTSRRRQLADMSDEAVVCRVLLGNHTPTGYPKIYPRPGGGWDVVFRCAYCGTEITKARDRQGFRVSNGNRYKHPPGYLMEEGGPLTMSEKAALFRRAAGGR